MQVPHQIIAGDGAIPFNTQFFHDDYDDVPGFDDVYEGDAGGPNATASSAEDQDLLAATQGQGRRVRPEFVNYTKRAKRVDVRKLKENIWKNLNIVVSHGQKDEEGDASMVSYFIFLNVVDVDLIWVTTQNTLPPTDPSEARVFDSVISGLHQSYPREKMEEISTSFCFICLLHLANEQGLKIEIGTRNDGGGGAEGGRVGDLWGLKVGRTLTRLVTETINSCCQVFRDPDASPAA